MHEMKFGNEVRQILNQAPQLDENTLSRLRMAREQALQRQCFDRPVLGLAWATNLVGNFGGFAGFSLRLLVPLAVLVGGLFAINEWQQNQRVREIEEIDALLLTDELPLAAFLDQGFETWLKKKRPTF